MDKRFIKRLISFDDEGVNTSTGFVSATGNPESEMIDEETSGWLQIGIHTFGSSHYWLHVADVENWRFDVKGVEVKYTNKGNLYIHINNNDERGDVEIKMKELEKDIQMAIGKYGAEPLNDIILVLPDKKPVGVLDLHFTDGFMYNASKGESFFKKHFYFKGSPQNLPKRVEFTNAYYYLLSNDRKAYIISGSNAFLPVKWWIGRLNESVVSQNLISFDEDDISTGYVNVSGDGKLTTVDGVLRELPKFFKERGINVWISKPKVEDAGTEYEARYVNIKFRSGPYIEWQTTLGIKDFDNVRDHLEYYANQNPDTLRWESKGYSTMQPYDIERVQDVIKDFLNTAL